jgi:GAF domain-containing protein
MLAAAAEGRWFHVESLAEENRWPEFIPRAIEGGIASILSTPLMVATRPVGALNIYSNAERAFRPAEQELAALFATQASGILTDAGVEFPPSEPASDCSMRPG